MVEKNVNICDVCKERIAKWICEVCNKDICAYCGKRWNISLSNVNKIEISFCKKCLNHQYEKDILDDIKKNIIEKMKKGDIIEKLK